MDFSCSSDLFLLKRLCLLKRSSWTQTRMNKPGFGVQHFNHYSLCMASSSIVLIISSTLLYILLQEEFLHGEGLLIIGMNCPRGGGVTIPGAVHEMTGCGTQCHPWLSWQGGDLSEVGVSGPRGFFPTLMILWFLWCEQDSGSDWEVEAC